MIEVRISGNNMAELLRDASGLMMVLAQGAAPRGATPNAGPIAAGGEDKFPASDAVGAETADDEKAVAPKKRGRKPAQTPEAEPVGDPTKLPEADFLDDEPKPAAPSATIEEVKQAVQAALEAAQHRLEGEYPNFAKLKGKELEAANQKILAGKVALVKPLLQQFGAAKVTELKPEHYADFVVAAQAYIDGES